MKIEIENVFFCWFSSQMSQQLEPGQDEARGLELPSDLPCGCQDPSAGPSYAVFLDTVLGILIGYEAAEAVYMVEAGIICDSLTQHR